MIYIRALNLHIHVCEKVRVKFIAAIHDGALDGGPQRHMSILRYGNVCLCHLFFSMSHVEFKK